MSGASQEDVSQQVESVVDSLRDYIQDISSNLTGGISSFITGLKRPDGSPVIGLWR